jgi:CubicO group peptidase (beta-lactamase class C family)
LNETSPAIVVLTLLSLLGTATASPAVPAPPDSLPARWQRVMRDLNVPGMAVVVVRDTGLVRMELLGLREVERARPVTSGTRFYIASCTKPFVATAAAVLAAEGRLDLSAPVRRYLPEFRLADPGLSDSITVRDLLGHRFGLVSRAITRGEAYTGQMTEERYYRLLARVSSGRRFRYSNLHYTLVGRVIEAVTGRSWKRVVERRLFAPAGMTRSTCSARVLEADTNAARPYTFDSGHLAVSGSRKTEATMHAAGGIVTTPADLARWMRLELNDGRIDGRQVLPAAALLATREPVAWDAAERHPLVETERRLAWGAGWEVREYRGDTLYCHNGEFSGAAAFVSYMPARHLGVAVVANGSGAAVALAEMAAADAYDAALGTTGPDPLPRLMSFAARPAPADTTGAPTGRLSRPVRAYAGRYLNEDWGTVEVRAAAGGLAARMGAMPMPIVLVATDGFVAAADYPGRFELGARGQVAAMWMRIAPGDSVRFARR